MRYKFGEWSPDQPCFENTGLYDVRNTVPSEGGHYEPFPSASPISDAVSVTANSAIAVRDTSGTSYLFVAGKTNLYRQSASAWANVDRTASYSANSADSLDIKWSFAQFGDGLYACNGNNAMQFYTLGTSTQFLNMSASASAPEAAYLATVRDHMFAARINGFENRVQWSRINNPTRWTPSVRFQADYQDIPNGGYVQGITGGDFATILMEESIYRASYVGSPLIYRFDELAPGIGCLAPYSVARFQAVTFFLSRSGFYAFDGNQAIPIGDNKIDDWFLDNSNAAYYGNMTATIDPVRKLYMVSFASSGSATGAPDRTLIYNWATQRWSYLTVGYRALFGARTVGYTLEGLDAISTDLDALGISLDSDQWKGGTKFYAAIDNDFKLCEFTGAALTAQFETGCAQIVEDRRSFVTGVRPLVEGTTAKVTAAIGKRDRLIDNITWTSSTDLNSNGWCPQRANSRYHRVRMNISGSFTHAVGFDFYSRPEGLR